MFGVGLGFLLALVAPQFRRLESEVSPDVVVIRRRGLIRKRAKRIELSRVESVEVEPSSARAGLVDPTQHYSLFLRTAEGRRIEAVGTFRERRIAEAAAGEVRELVRRLQDARSASVERAESPPADAMLADKQLQQA